jgi:RES domain-containing protein
LSGVAIVEATDASGLAKWVLQWGDLFSFTTAPALTDEELGAALAAHRANSK